MRRALQAVEIDQPGLCSGEPALPAPTCAPPHILSASANAGYYRADQNINLQFQFSRPVRSAGPVNVLAHMGDRNTTTTICTLDLSETADSAECFFKVRTGDNAARFRIDGLEPAIKLPIIDEDSIAATNLIPEQNFSKGAVIIDTESPLGTVNINNGEAETSLANVALTHSARDNNSGVEFYRVSNDGERFSNWLAYTSASVWDLYNAEAGGGELPSVAGRYSRRVYVQFKDKAGNVSKTHSDEIIFNRMTAVLRTPVLSATSSPGEESGPRAVDTRSNTVFSASSSASSASPTSSAASARATSSPAVSYPSSAPVQLLVREPDFNITVKQSGLTVYLTGSINYWGKGGACENPRSANSIIVRWGDGSASTPIAKSKSFSASHLYKKGGAAYDLVVTLTNGCSGYKIKRFTIKSV